MDEQLKSLVRALCGPRHPDFVEAVVAQVQYLHPNAAPVKGAKKVCTVMISAAITNYDRY